ncbi:GNAT family N-acetyltransferase [Paenibacillus hunanensis]|uniref:GNAT family N-acetyltransferase n=1 Tax=Paenibacillus hunanensis TaxID=539262 RepID=UPI002025DE57|nr:GNAT family protein [Paenibacillus hunanensis]MCL9659921.1 GNAT family N-acetyltransferase [Paenibacillus hunanensis]
MITELQTERLIVRQIKVSDAPELFRIWSDPVVTPYMNISPFQTEDQALEMIELLQELAQEDKAVRFSIIYKETNTIIGSCGYNFLDDEQGKAEIGYDLAQTYWGKGYASEAIGLLVDYAFSSLQFNRIEAKVMPENRSSIKLLQRLHFTCEGMLQEYDEIDGQRIDLHMYSRLKWGLKSDQSIYKQGS